MSLGAWLGEAFGMSALFFLSLVRLVRLVLTCLASLLLSRKMFFCKFDSCIFAIQQLSLPSRKPKNVTLRAYGMLENIGSLK